MKHVNVPSRFADATIKAWREQTNNDAVADVLDKYIEDAPLHYNSGRGLLILGPPGVGKTYLVCALLLALGKRYDTRFVTMPVYLRAGLRLMSLREQWAGAQYREDEDEAYERWKRIQKEIGKLRSKYDFVAMDDVGMEHHSANRWTEDEFQMLVRVRFDLALPTLVTSNYSLDDWGTVYGPSMRSFIKEAFITVVVTGDDLREAR